MPNRPLLVFPKPKDIDPPSRASGSGGGLRFDDKEGQAQRVYKQFGSVLSEFHSDDSGDIEKILVIETIGTISDFYKAAQSIDGLEWLAEIDEDEDELEADWDFLYGESEEKKNKAKKMGGRLYLAVSNEQAVKRLLGLWEKWNKGKELERGYGIWKNMFEQIHVIRLWDYEDMLHNTGFLEEFQECIEKGETIDYKTEIPFEVELHCRKGKSDIDKVHREFVKEIEDKGGSVIGFACIPEVRFHALRIMFPIALLQPLISENDEDKKRLTYLSPAKVKYCRPMSTVQKIYDDGVTEAKSMTFSDCNDNPPIIALLDGAPVLKHEYLDKRILFDDPDDYALKYDGNKSKKHGTAMASLICHDDLNLKPEHRLSLPRKIYVRPIMVEADIGMNKIIEKIPDEIFLEDIIMRSVKRMFDDIKGEPAVAKTIRIINLSIGNPGKVFLHEMSSTARVLDYLSSKYQVLFIISAGNSDAIFNSKHIGDGPPFSADRVIYDVDRREKEWRIIEPAESINGLTVGAVNEDNFDEEDKFDLLHGHRAAALYSRLGNGFRRQIKPDILVAGGKSHYKLREYQKLKQWEQDEEYRNQGLVTAYPNSSKPEDLSDTKATIGTSNSTALTTHTAGELYEILEKIRNEHANSFDEKYNALLIKALLVHGASRAEISRIYETLKKDMNRRRWKAYLSRYCGYGIPDFDRVKECTDYRVVALGCGDIEERKRHEFSLPIPSQCNQSSQIKLIITLAWFSPIDPSHQLLRKAKLFFQVAGVNNPKRSEYDWQQVRKGTLQHEIFEVPSGDLGDQINISVDCYAAMGNLDQSISYGLAVTLQVSENIDIYEDIKDAIDLGLPISHE